MIIDMNESTVFDKKVLRKMKQFYKELQYIKVTKKGCCGIEFLEVENPPRQTIYLDEIIFYLTYKELERTAPRVSQVALPPRSAIYRDKTD